MLRALHGRAEEDTYPSPLNEQVTYFLSSRAKIPSITGRGNVDAGHLGSRTFQSTQLQSFWLMPAMPAPNTTMRLSVTFRLPGSSDEIWSFCYAKAKNGQRLLPLGPVTNLDIDSA